MGYNGNKQVSCLHSSYFYTNTVNVLRFWWFVSFHVWRRTAPILICRKVLTNLKLFVKKKYLRSRRAPCACIITHKYKSGNILCKLIQMWWNIARFWWFYEFSCLEKESSDSHLQKSFDKSQIVCQEKISEILQSSLCLYYNT